MPALLILLQSQTQQATSGTFCNQQDRLFATNFDYLAVLIAAGLAFFALPLISIFLARRWWSFSTPLRRWLIISGLFGTAALIVFVGLPALALDGAIDPGAGLLAYPGVEPRYVTVCPNESFRETRVFFGWLGVARKAAVAQPYALFTALVLAAGIWSGLYWLAIVGWRRTRGLAAG